MGAWPKILPPLSADQQRISDDFYAYWHTVLPRHFGLIERFNHGFPVRHSPPTFRTTLELGAGLGGHLTHERLTPAQAAGYVALELRPHLADVLRARHPAVQVVVGDCQARQPFADGSFDRVLAIHVLEHLPNLPAAIAEAARVLDPGGAFLVVIPTEGSLAYTLARKVSAERLFRKRYGMDYRWFYTREHLNRPREILAALDPYFTVRRRRYFPLPWLPVTACNLCIGLVLVKRPGRGSVND